MIARAFLAGLVVLAACGVRTQVDTLGPDFEGQRTVRMRGNVLPTPVDGIGAIELNAERVERPEQPPAFALLVEVRAEGLAIRPGMSLRLILDGDSLALARDSTVTTWPRVDPSVREQARYPAADSVMRRLAAAEDVRIALRGAAWWERRRLSAANLQTLRDFVERHVPPDSAAAP